MNLPFFPESFWPPVDQSYKTILNRGLDRASKSKVYICGICRDCEPAIGVNLIRIDYLRKFFSSSDIFIYENDSSDFTAKLVDEWAKNRYRVIFTSEKLGTRHEQDKSLNRRSNMAKARNTYLEHGRKNKFQNHDWMIVLDLDLLGGWSYEGILHSIGLMGQNTIFGSNGLIYNPHRQFYDSWAYRELGSKEHTDEYANNIVFHRGEQPIEVDSCFGGCAIYPASVLETDCLYGDYDCDHVTYHNSLRSKGYNVFLNPSQITLYSEHYYV